MSEPENQQPETPEEKPVEQPRPRTPVVLIPRLGNMQATVEYRGEGIYRRPVVRFVKLIPPDVLQRDPSVINVYEIEEIATLHALLSSVLHNIYQLQTLAVPNAEPPTLPRPGVAQVREPPPVPAPIPAEPVAKPEAPLPPPGGSHKTIQPKHHKAGRRRR